jgi:hypothetical protein
MFFRRSLIGATSKAITSTTTSAKVLALDGSTQYGTHTRIVIQENADWTLLCWIQTTSTDSTSTSVANPALTVFGDTDVAVSCGFGVNNGKIQFIRYITDWTSNKYNSTASVNGGSLKLIGARYDASATNLDLIIDGSVDSSHTLANGSLDLGFNIIGAGESTADFFDGDLFLPHIYTSHLSNDNLTSFYNGGIPLQPWELTGDLASNQALSVPCNASTNSNTYSDYSGNAYDLTMSGSPSLSGGPYTIKTSADPGP